MGCVLFTCRVGQIQNDPNGTVSAMLAIHRVLRCDSDTGVCATCAYNCSLLYYYITAEHYPFYQSQLYGQGREQTEEATTDHFLSI